MKIMAFYTIINLNYVLIQIAWVQDIVYIQFKKNLQDTNGNRIDDNEY